ncbi:3-hydroxy-2-methylbutyryl-CoA dehydrogenase [Parafrankia colletiae]|uniref:3-hydroxy-2-methylbutyryl-CoA dehydrogenase n=1 Tax=Parafrankia colletiae TaxID=573497 RepID=A0A1S1QHW3_9ACTN|nr:SDR family NAD(P)-dependent oxidoreductase [Parafrankia colletiae]MCK9902010.1 SDR family NAD(P)-dependent oxidoreductase [Frankia sp. Cpl3]OHV33257.1 3-hydroxy-2-methylbutyryl-CoA dehydrogenase [Parafrankia colletiae]
MQLNGQSTLVTGGASGLGLGTTRVLLERGASVTIVDLPSSPGKDVAAELGVRFVAADITDTDQFEAALDAAAADGPLRGVVHCAGRGGDRLRILDREGRPGAIDSYADIIRINLVGTYNVVRLAAARMARNSELLDGDRGAVVLTASVAAFEGQIGQTAYASAKAGVRGMTIVAARDLASWAIRVNTIAPGVFETPMLGRLRDDIRDGLAAGVPHPKRLGTPADFGRLATDLLENGYINGEVIRLDGALRMAPR